MTQTKQPPENPGRFTLQYPVDRNWVMVGEGNTTCLTDEGRKLITRDFN